MKRRTLIQILGASALTSTLGMLTQPAAAQSTAGLIVPFPAGGGADVLARSIADAFGRELGLTFWTANHPGAGGTLGAQYLSRQHPDGGYVGYVTNGILCVNPLLYPKTPFDPMASLEPVGRISEIGLVAVLNPHAIEGVNSLETLLTFGQKNPGKLTFASSGIGTTSHLAGMLFSLRTGIEMLHIPYRGGNAAMMDVLAGRIPFMIDVAPNTLPHIRAGKLKALGSASPNRLAAAPDIPTLAECGLVGVELSAWDGIALPKGASPELVERYSAALSKALNDPAVSESLAKKGAEIRPGTPADFRAWIASERPKWAELVKAVQAETATEN